jgi:isoleucyl-tRNA synthetase
MFSSVHLSDFCVLTSFINIDTGNMDVVRDVCATVFSLRKASNIRVRMPLRNVKLFVTDKNIVLSDEYISIIKDEVNVHNVELCYDNFDDVIGTKFSINLKECGQKYGKNVSIIMNKVNNDDCFLDDGNLVVGDFVLLPHEFSLFYLPKKGSGAVAKCNHFDVLVLLDTAIDNNLIEEGMARDFIRFIQQKRKDLNLNIIQRINLSVLCTKNDSFECMLNNFNNVIKSQTLCDDLEIKSFANTAEMNSLVDNSCHLSGEIMDNMFYISITNV